MTPPDTIQVPRELLEQLMATCNVAISYEADAEIRAQIRAERSAVERLLSAGQVADKAPDKQENSR